MGKSYVGDIGTRIRTTLNEDLTNQSTTEYRVKKPDDSTDVWDAGDGFMIENETTGIVYYDSKTGDFDQAGKFKIQTYVLFSDGDTFLSETRTFTIYDPYE